jgi:hypothetical protein
LDVPVKDVDWSQDMGRLLREGKVAAICRAVRPDAAWRAVINQSVHWVMVSGLLLCNVLSVVVVGLDV